MQLKRMLPVAMIVGAAIMSSQCGDSNVAGPSSPGAATPTTVRAVGDITNATAELGKIKVCKVGNVSGTFTVSGGSAGVAILPNPTIPAGQCWVVAEDHAPAGVPPASAGASVTITETPSTFLQSTSLQRNDAGVISAGTFSNGGTLFLNNFHGFTITFTNNEPPPPPPPGDQGCTPGFWKQKQHLDSWTTYSPSADFDATFSVNFFSPNITLLAALGLPASGIEGLARAGAAALLNVANAGVAYPYTLAQVLDIVQGDGAYAGLSVDERKNLLSTANELGCPLN
jgi:hypothetical protein